MSRAELLYDVLRHIRPIHQASAKWVTDSLAGSELTMPMRAVLERVHDDGSQTVPQLARSLWLTRQAVQRIVDDASALGYVELHENPAHRRSRLVVLTATGSQVFAGRHDTELENLERIAAELSETDIEASIRVLAHLSASLRELVEDPPGGDMDITSTSKE